MGVEWVHKMAKDESALLTEMKLDIYCKTMRNIILSVVQHFYCSNTEGLAKHHLLHSFNFKMKRPAEEVNSNCTFYLI